MRFWGAGTTRERESARARETARERESERARERKKAKRKRERERKKNYFECIVYIIVQREYKPYKDKLCLLYLHTDLSSGPGVAL